MRLKRLGLPNVEICRLGGDEFGFLYLGDIYEAASTGQSIAN